MLRPASACTPSNCLEPNQMARSEYQQETVIQNFRAGLHREVDVYSVPTGGCVDTANLLMSRGNLTSRPPRRFGAVYSSLPAPIRFLMPYKNSRSSTTSMLIVADEEVWVIEDVDSIVAPYGGSVMYKLDTLVNRDNPVRMAVMNERVYIVDGEGPVRVWYGGPHIGEVFQNDGDGYGPSVAESSVFTGTDDTDFIVIITKAGVRGTAEFRMVYYTPSGGYVSSAATVTAASTAISYGVTLEWPEEIFVAGNSWRFQGTTRNHVKYLTDPPKPQYSPEIKGRTLSSNKIYTGEYKFCYTYEWYDGVGFTEGPPSPVAEVVYTEDADGDVSIEVRIDQELPFMSYDRLHVYVVGGPVNTWRRFYTTDILGKPETVALTWDGTIPDEAEILDEYVDIPPKGCEIVYEHNFRMFYTKGNMLYVSDVNDPERVPQKTVSEMYEELGGTKQLDSGRNAITGIRGSGTDRLIFMENCIWRMTGITAQDFQFKQLTQEYGCARHEAIVAMDAVNLMWLDAANNTVCAWDGQQITQPGATGTESPVTEILRQELGTVVHNAYAAYNARTGSAYFYLPDSMNDMPSAKGRSLIFSSGTWNMFEREPDGYAVYVSGNAFHGIYATDPTQKIIYRLYDDDGIGSTDEPTIWFRWKSGVLLPLDWTNKDIEEIIVLLGEQWTDENDLVSTLDLTIHDATQLVDLSHIVTTQTVSVNTATNHLTWRPEEHAVPMALLEISGSVKTSIDGFAAINAILLRHFNKGNIHGRQL